MCVLKKKQFIMAERLAAPPELKTKPSQFSSVLEQAEQIAAQEWARLDNIAETTAPDVTKQNLQAEINGFSNEQAERVKSRMESYGLPLVNINTLNYKPEDPKIEGLMGSYRPYSGDMDLHKPVETLSAAEQDKVMIHEIAHSDSVLDPENRKLFKSLEAYRDAKDFAVSAAVRSLETNTYLNGYQAALAKALDKQEIDDKRYYEETFAILVELRFTNPAHLEQVEAAQNDKATKMNSNLKPLALKDGIDQSLVALMPNIRSKEELDTHVKKLRADLADQGPILPNIQAPDKIWKFLGIKK